MISNATSLITSPAMKNALSYGEYLSYAKYAKYVPGAPSILSHRATPWIGDSCRLANATMRITAHLDEIRSTEISLDHKVSSLIQIALLVLRISQTQFGQYFPVVLPHNIGKVIGDTYKTAQTGVACKAKFCEIGSTDTSVLGTLKDKIEALRLGALTANSALALTGTSLFSRSRFSLLSGYALLSVAKMGISAAHFFSKLGSGALL